MQPRVVLITQYPTGAQSRPRVDAQLKEVLSSIGVWVFGRDKNAVWQLRQQLPLAHAVLIVVELPPIDYPDRNTAFEDEVAEVVKYHANNPRLQVLPVVERNTKKPPELENFPPLEFAVVLEPPELRDIVDFVFNAARSPDDEVATPVKTPDTDTLIAKGKVELNRLQVLAEEPAPKLFWSFVAAAVALVGLALSIPDVLSRFALSDYWLLFGPVILIIGALTTIYLVRRHTLGQRQQKIASLMQRELESILNQLEKPSNPRVTPQTTNG